MPRPTMTLLQLCKAIYNASLYLSREDRDEIARVYARTWALATLTVDRLADPTDDARPRLQDLYEALATARSRRERLVWEAAQAAERRAAAAAVPTPAPAPTPNPEATP